MIRRPTSESRGTPGHAGGAAPASGFPIEELLGPLNPLERLHAPTRLFVAGHPEWLLERPKVSIIGARQASGHGRKRAARLARILVRHGVIVVRGLAEGIDAAAHRATLASGGRTIAVIGTPLSDCYPPKHRELQARLMREHLVVSQFRAGQPVSRRNFPLRNRTMALATDATVIAEAGEGSGSLSQGWEALRLGRPLFLMASILDNTMLAWPKTLLDHGAMILKGPEDLLGHLPSRVDDPTSAIA